MDLRKGLLALADRLEALATRLPEPLRRPILAEFRPLKELFLVRRAPLLLLVAQSTADSNRLLRWLVGSEQGIEAWEEHPGWLRLPGMGEREPGIGLLPVGIDRPGLTQEALQSVRPDAIVVMSSEKDLSNTLSAVGAFIGVNNSGESIIASGHVILTDHQTSGLGGEVVLRLRSAWMGMVGRVWMWGGEVLEGGQEVLERLADALPPEARLAFVRQAAVPGARRRLARSVVQSITAVSAAVGAQPIPLADLPVLASLQALMVAAVMDISGRRADLKSGSEFLASIGVNLGAAFVFREGARAAVKVVPGFGNAISGGVAAAGTYAMGRAAIAYFIEGVDLKRARAIFRLGRRRKPAPELGDPTSHRRGVVNNL